MACNDLTVQCGATFSTVVRWETTPIVYKTITGITAAAPPVITAATHGAPDGWRVAVANVQGMTQINAAHEPPRASEYHAATVLSANTLSLNDVNAAGYDAYTAGGVLQYNTPKDLTGYTARMMIKNRLGGTVLAELTTENGGIAISTSAYTITLSISATDTALITASRGVYDLELISSGGTVTRLAAGRVIFEREVTTA